MENIEFKRINDELFLRLNDLVDFQNIYDSLDEKLNIIKEQNKSELMINLELGNRKISTQDLFCLYELFLKDEKLLIKSIKYDSLQNEPIEVYKGTIRGGETKYFDKSVLILGDINPNALVIAKDEVYVVGKVKGKVFIRSKEGGINAASFCNSIIKIFDLINYNINYNCTKFLKYNDLVNNVGGENNVKNYCCN